MTAVSAFSAILFLAAVAFADPPAGASWRLKYSDEFSGSQLDETKWGFGFGWGTNSGSFDEQNRRQNLTLANGMATIKAEESNGTYYSAAINTKGKMMMKYGYWEARVQITGHVAGCDPGFWQKLADESWPPELDIYEYFGTNSKQAMTIHWNSGGHQQSSSQADIGSAAQFRVYGLHYTPDSIRWITDGVVVRRNTPATHGTFFEQWKADQVYTMFNVHLTNKYDWLGSVDKSKLPFYVNIDYFRMYEVGNPVVTKELAVCRAQTNAGCAAKALFAPMLNRIAAGAAISPSGRRIPTTPYSASTINIVPGAGWTGLAVSPGQ